MGLGGFEVLAILLVAVLRCSAVGSSASSARAPQTLLGNGKRR